MLISVYRLLVCSLAIVPSARDMEMILPVMLAKCLAVNISCSLACSNNVFKAFILFGGTETKPIFRSKSKESLSWFPSAFGQMFN